MLPSYTYKGGKVTVGLIGVDDCIASEKRNLDFYLGNSKKERLQYVSYFKKENIEVKM